MCNPRTVTQHSYLLDFLTEVQELLEVILFLSFWIKKELVVRFILFFFVRLSWKNYLGHFQSYLISSIQPSTSVWWL